MPSAKWKKKTSEAIMLRSVRQFKLYLKRGDVWTVQLQEITAYFLLIVIWTHISFIKERLKNIIPTL